MVRGRIGQNERSLVLQVLDSEEFSSFYRKPYGGRFNNVFELQFLRYIGVNHAVAVSNGTTALQAAYLACGIGQGDEVITTPLTFVATASMIIACGAKPVFVDVNPLTYNIDPELIEKEVTKKTKAIVPVHLIGHPCEMDYINEIADKHDLWVIEDACQSLSAEYKGKKTGSLADIGIFSFQETKQITSGGEGGMITTDNDELAEKCRRIRNNGAKYFQDPDILGFNFRMTEMQAALGSAQMDKLDMFNKAQKENALHSFNDLPKGITPPYVSPTVKHTYYICGCLYDEEKAGMKRAKFIEEINKRKINRMRPGETVGGGYSETVPMLPYFRKHGLYKKCPEAEKLLETSFYYDVNRFPHKKEDMDKFTEALHLILRK